MRGEGQLGNEGPCISKEDLRQMQGHQPPWGGSRDLRKRKAQAAPGLIESGNGRKLQESEQCTVDSDQLMLIEQEVRRLATVH
jgi:hypothetical protein